MARSYGQRKVLVENARVAGFRLRGYLGLVAVTAGFLVFVAWFPWLPARGVLAGVVLGANGMLLLLTVTRAGEPAVKGQYAERLSVQALRKAGRWLVTANLSFDGLDVDQVAVAPAAVLAVETKYRGKAFDGKVEQDRHQRELAAAERGARKVRLLLQSRKLRDQADVLPVLMVWGPGRPALPDGHRLDGAVLVLDGDCPRLWAHLFSAPALDERTRAGLHRCFQDWAAERDGHDARALPPLRSGMWTAFVQGVRDAESKRAATRALHRSLRRPPACAGTAAPETGPAASVTSGPR